MYKTIGILLLTAGTMLAETVYFSPRGKTYHNVTTCMALARSKVKLQADKSAATTHGLKPCGICYRPKAQKKAGNERWAQGVK